jgi:hypothetical protein
LPAAEATHPATFALLAAVAEGDLVKPAPVSAPSVVPASAPPAVRAAALAVAAATATLLTPKVASAPADPTGPGALVWARQSGFPWFPAEVVDPAAPSDAAHTPSASVLAARPKTAGAALRLVLFFDKTRSWAWLAVDRLLPMFADIPADLARAQESKKEAQRRDVQAAYEEASAYRKTLRARLRRAAPDP